MSAQAEEKRQLLQILQGHLLCEDDYELARQIIYRSIEHINGKYYINMDMSLLRDALFTIEHIKKGG